MLEELAVANLGLIAGARVEPSAGFTVITGESGTGKTFLLGALRLLMGASAGSDQVGPAGPEATIEGRFTTHDGGEAVAARRLVAGGRSRAYLDGAMAPNRLLEERIGPLVELVGQHDHLAMTRPSELRALLDGSLDETGAAARRSYEAAWARLGEVRRDQEAVGSDQRGLARDLELLLHQADEIAAAGFAPGDEEELRIRAGRLRNAEELQADLGAAHAALASDGGAGDDLGGVVDALRRAARLDPSLADLVTEGEDLSDRLTELASELARRAADIEAVPEDLATVEARLALLGDLKRKYGADVSEVLDYGRQAAFRAVHLQDLAERAAGIEAELAAAELAARDGGAQLADARRRSAKLLADAALIELKQLGLGDPVVEFAVAAAEPGPDGADRVGLAFSSDRSLPPGPIGRVASGGELSRLVLALRLAGGAGSAPIVAFDEVDSGVGGATALELGRKLAGLAEARQVLCVTHLPQVAAFADLHVVVERREGRAEVMVVEGEQRLEELSRMLSGLPESERGREHAGELLALAKTR